MSAVRYAARRRHAGFAITVLVWAFISSPSGQAQDVAAQDEMMRQTEPQSRFVRTVLQLQDAYPQVRSEFAATALSHLASAYASEARLARHDARQRSWSATVDGYASQMPLLLDDVELGLPVSLTLEGDNSLAITVGDRTVILSHPRLSQQGALEQGILKDFCSRQACEQIETDNSSLEPIAASAATRLRSSWNFNERGSECSYEGITVRFRNDLNMAHARAICEQFLHEVMALGEELAWQRRHAVEIQWEQLDIQPTPGRPEHMVRLNTLGDSVLVTAPLLHASPGLLKQVLPWLRQRLDDSAAVNIELDAASYGWQEP